MADRERDDPVPLPRSPHERPEQTRRDPLDRHRRASARLAEVIERRRGKNPPRWARGAGGDADEQR